MQLTRKLGAPSNIKQYKANEEQNNETEGMGTGTGKRACAYA
jgi:hypothetical protein